MENISWKTDGHDMERAIRQRVLMLDGAMGTMIQQYDLSENNFRGCRFADYHLPLKGNNDILNITSPDIISQIHRRYLEAGADIITTNTFCSQRISQSEYDLEHAAREMALEGARIARRTADEYAAVCRHGGSEKRDVWVAGSVGPTGKMLSLSSLSDSGREENLSESGREDKVSYDVLLAAYREQVDALVEGGVDAVLIETVFDTLNAKVALRATVETMESLGVRLPIMLSITLDDKTGRTLCGQSIEAFLASVSDFPIFSVGLNCSFGANAMKPFLKELSDSTAYYVSAYPNAGLPNALGKYDETPDNMAETVREYINERLVNIVGGCCGTTDEYIRRFSEVIKEESRKETIGNKEIRKGEIPCCTFIRIPPSDKNSCLHLSGLDVLKVTSEKGFINIGERCNVAGSKKFLRLIGQKDYSAAVNIAREQVKKGALVIDINMDDALIDAKREMATFLKLIDSEPEIARIPVMIDSSDWNVIEEGLKCVQGKCIVNSLSLKEGEDIFVERARTVKKYGAAIVIMCFDEKGQATTYDRRIEIAERAYRILTQKVGISPHSIIFDPNILTIATGIKEHSTYALDFLNATRWIKQNCPQAHVCGGLSNLSFSFRGNNYIREAMHAVFLYHAIQAGMDFGIVNAAMGVMYTDIPQDVLKAIEDVIFNRDDDVTERLVRVAEKTKPADKGSNVAEDNADDYRGSHSVVERLLHAIVKGENTYLEADIKEALTIFPSVIGIVDGPLMMGMDAVGKLFSEGKLFLPQVIKSAQTMKQAVTILQPHIVEEEKQNKADAAAISSKRIMLATVKGDVHDIGKNIVGIIMACNGYGVDDLGVMVASEHIVDMAIERKADMIGLSGLITPSLDEMVNVVRKMQQRGLTIPVMIGGATTNEMFVALRVAPEYDGTVVWVADASQNPVIASKLMNEVSAAALRKQLDERYELLRNQYQSSHSELISVKEARSNKMDLF